MLLMKCKSFQKRFKSKTQRMMNKRANLESMIKIIGWIVFFGIALVALYFLIRRFTG